MKLLLVSLTSVDINDDFMSKAQKGYTLRGSCHSRRLPQRRTFDAQSPQPLTRNPRGGGRQPGLGKRCRRMAVAARGVGGRQEGAGWLGRAGQARRTGWTVRAGSLGRAHGAERCQFPKALIIPERHGANPFTCAAKGAKWY